MAIAQKPCAVAEKACSTVSVGDPTTRRQICSELEHLTAFACIEGGCLAPRAQVQAPSQHLKHIDCARYDSEGSNNAGRKEPCSGRSNY